MVEYSLFVESSSRIAVMTSDQPEVVAPPPLVAFVQDLVTGVDKVIS